MATLLWRSHYKTLVLYITQFPSMIYLQANHVFKRTAVSIYRIRLICASNDIRDPFWERGFLPSNKQEQAWHNFDWLWSQISCIYGSILSR